MQVLKSVSFVYQMQEDQILAAINPGGPDAWSCWLTRRVALLLVERAAQLLVNTSDLAQRAPAELRGEAIAFEHASAMAKTAQRMSQTPINALKPSATAAELVKSMAIANQGDKFRMQLNGLAGGGAQGILARAGLQRVLQMLQDEMIKGGWLTKPGKPRALGTADKSGLIPSH